MLNLLMVESLKNSTQYHKLVFYKLLYIFHSPDVQNSQDWTRIKLGSSNAIWVSYVGNRNRNLST